MRPGITWSLLAVSVALVSACAERAMPTGFQVELDAYSGRANPVWTLTEEETEEVLRRLRGLPHVTEILPADGLGYRGFVLIAPARAGFPGEARVAAGLIALGASERAVVYRDALGLEPFLMQLARARGHGAVLKGR